MKNENLTLLEKNSLNKRKQYLKLLNSLLPKEKLKNTNNIFTKRKNYRHFLPFIKNKNDNHFNSSKIENNLSEGNNNKLRDEETITIRENKKGKYFRNKRLDIRTKRNNKYKNSEEVNNIVNSLINSSNNNIDKNIYSYDKAKENKKFPREKTIDKSFNKYMQDINESKKEEIVLNTNREINYGKIQVDPSNYINNEDENKFKYMLRQIREKRNFNFGTRDINYFKKIKNPIISFDKRKKENDNKLLLKLRKLLIDINKKNKTKFIESNIYKKIDKCKSFDERMDIILNNTKITEANINKTSKYHEKLINKINYIYKSY